MEVIRPGTTRYLLPGVQLDPGAPAWLEHPVPQLVTLAELLPLTDAPGTEDYMPVWKEPEDIATGDEREDIAELHELAGRLDDPDAIDTEEQSRERLPVSFFLQLRPAPLGAVVRHSRPSEPLIEKPRELARYFETGTPGLAHRHALQYLLPPAGWPPTREALAWTALHIAIQSALLAAWHYKWRSTRPFTSGRPRPVEVDPSILVLFDHAAAFDSAGELIDGPRRDRPAPFPGTPRSPSYPSAQSAYASAASEVLSWFFPAWRQELHQLADNTGLARLWAGVNFRADHRAGMRLGRTVARLVIRQLDDAGIEQVPEQEP